MSGPTQADPRPLESKAELIEALSSGEKPRQDWRIGTEHEKFVFHQARPSDLGAAQQSGMQGARASYASGIRPLLEALKSLGWAPIEDQGNLVGLTRDGAAISLEPGGQFELSGATLESLHQTCDEAHRHLAELKPLCERLGLSLLGLGHDPVSQIETLDWMPKSRYAIMRRYMPQKGGLGHDMMLNTTTIQVNLDFSSEADMVQKLRVGLALQPLATALFANSPLRHGQPAGYRSFRAHTWSDTDPERTGGLDFVFEAGMGYERYVDYALDVPMYFVTRNRKPIDLAGASFRRFFESGLDALPGERALHQDWSDHLTTLFPDVRLKSFLEMRGADGGSWADICALPAFWVGLLYDQSALDAASDLIADWSAEERATLRQATPKYGLDWPFRGRSLWDWAAELVNLADAGLKSRKMAGKISQDETEYLAPLHKRLAERRHASDAALDIWKAVDGDFAAFLERMAY